MLGIPGIGKSRSLALGLWYLVGNERPEWVPDWVQPKVIVWEARRGQKVFFFMKDFKGEWKARSQSLKRLGLRRLQVSPGREQLVFGGHP